MGVYSPSYYSYIIVLVKNLIETEIISEFTNAVLTEAEAQNGWTYASTPSAYIS